MANQSTVQKVSTQIDAPNVPSTIEIGTIPALIGIVVFIFGLGKAWGNIKTLISGVQKTLDKMEPEVKDMKERLVSVETKVDTLWKDKFAPSNSPRQLNAKGQDILIKSGIKDIIESKKDKLLELVKNKGARNAYDAEIAILSVMMELPKHCPDSLEKLKTGAFKTGVDVDAVLFVGGIYLRNLIFPELGFSLDDLDKPKESDAK